MLVDHFIEIPQAIKQGLGNVGEGSVIERGGGQVSKQFRQYGVHRVRS